MMKLADNALFRWLERYVDPFPTPEPRKPPTTFWAFVRHYAWPFRRLIGAAVVLSTVSALLDVLLFAGIGAVIDWLGQTERESFFATHAWPLIGLSVLALIILPIVKLLDEAVINCGMLGNFPMRNRWQGHRFLLRQSMQFFQDDFAGRVATKVMQSALAVREVVVKLCEVLCYVGVYFIAAVILFAAADWRLALPMIGWFALYGL